MPAGRLTKEQIYGIDRKYLRERFDYCDSGKLIETHVDMKHKNLKTTNYKRYPYRYVKEWYVRGYSYKHSREAG